MAANARQACARARARKRSAGAAMFIVAITLALLAAMGVYGLSATAVDVRSAGHLREAAQAQGAAEHAMILTAETFTPGTAGALVTAMQSGTGGTAVQATKCKTSNVFNGTNEANADFRAAQACLSWDVAQMENLAQGVNPWLNLLGTANTSDRTTFSSDATGGSFGPVVNKAFLRVEVTNPVEMPPPPGSSITDRYATAQITATVFVEMKTAANVAADSIVLGRGRMTVPPYAR
jgi:hypothetical protein